MQFRKRCGLLGLLSLSVVLTTVVGPAGVFLAQQQRQICWESEAYLSDVAAVLPSLQSDGFRLVPLSNLDLTQLPSSFEFPLPDGTNQTIFGLSATSALDPALEGKLYGGVMVDQISNRVTAYSGGTGNVLASLYVGQNNLHISGFLNANIQDTASAWVFIEPLYPLLVPLNAGSLLDCAYEYKVHIIYDAAKTEFTINFEPDSNIESSTGKTSALTTLDPPVTVRLVGVADQAFYRKYDAAGSIQQWWEAQAELLIHVVHIYDRLLDTSKVNLKLRALEAWSTGGPASDILAGATAAASDVDRGYYNYDDAFVDVNAFNLLCDFAQGFTIRDLNVDGRFGGTNELFDPRYDSTSSSSLPGAVPETHNTTIADPYIVHLFSGYDLGPVPSEGLSDSGCCLCHSDNCGVDGKDIIGVAEGIGLWNNTSSTCKAASSDLDVALPHGAHHSLSQHVPKATECSSEGNCNVQALLIQRLLLVAHEIGHNLGAEHSDNRSIMSPQLNTMGTSLLGGLTLGNSYDSPSDPTNRGAMEDNVQRINDCVLSQNCDKQPASGSS